MTVPTPTPPGDTPERDDSPTARAIRSVRAQTLRDASARLASKYGVTNRAAGDLRRWADEIEEA